MAIDPSPCSDTAIVANKNSIWWLPPLAPKYKRLLSGMSAVNNASNSMIAHVAATLNFAAASLICLSRKTMRNALLIAVITTKTTFI